MDHRTNLRANINLLLQDIFSVYYATSVEEINLQREISRTYSLEAAEKLYKSISNESPYKRVYTNIKDFVISLEDLASALTKVRSLDRIQNNDIPEDLRITFAEEYYTIIEDIVDISAELLYIRNVFLHYF